MGWIELTLITVSIILLLIINAVGVFMVALQLPGTWTLLLATAGFAWLDAAFWHTSRDDWLIGWWTLGGLLALAILGELVEGLAGAIGAKGAGGSKRGMGLAILLGVVGAIIGTGAIPIPIIGTLIGAAIGSGFGSILGDLWAGREWKPALKSGQGAAVGRFAGSLGKLLIAAAMWLVVVIALIWP